MVKQSDRIIWIGYSWELTAGHCCLNVTADEGNYIDGRRIGEPSLPLSHYPLCWHANADPVPPPPPGIVDTLGISGIGGYLRDSQSHLSSQESEWLEQVKLIDQGFERILADMLTGILNSLLDPQQRVANNTKRTYVVIQGPAFPKLLGRMGYRRMLDRDVNLSVYFLNFRRRFLTPNPLVLEDGLLSSGDTGTDGSFGGMIYGPVPSDHEEAPVRKYYLLPAFLQPPHTKILSEFKGYSPLMLETFGQSIDKAADKAALVCFLEHLGMRKMDDGTIVVEENRIAWQEHPATPAFRQVRVPSPMLQANQASLDKLREILGSGSLAHENAPSDSVSFAALIPILRFVRDERIPFCDLVQDVLAANPDRPIPGKSYDKKANEEMMWFLRECRDNPDGVQNAAKNVVRLRANLGAEGSNSGSGA